MPVEKITDITLPAPAILAHMRDAILAWYHRHARSLPWRIPPGSSEAPDPYRIWLSEVMLQQTTVAAVTPKYQRFLTLWPRVTDLAADPDAVMSEWAGLGYYSRARNLVACAQQVTHELGGHFPATAAQLGRLPGIGPYTAAAIAAIAFGERAIAIDANVERVVSRLFAITTPLPAARPQIAEAADALWPDAAHAGDFAQALMDLGSGPCNPRTPDCPACPVVAVCAANQRGIAASLPQKAARKTRPERFGRVEWHVRKRDGECEVLMIRRPPKGLLGGMRALPGDDWGDSPQQAAHGARNLGAVRHIFTHFALTLEVDLAAPGTTASVAAAANSAWWPVKQLDAAGLPTLYRKAAALAVAQENAPCLI